VLERSVQRERDDREQRTQGELDGGGDAQVLVAAPPAGVAAAPTRSFMSASS